MICGHGSSTVGGARSKRSYQLPSGPKFLGQLFDWFKTCLTWSDYEEKTKLTATIHFKHFTRLIGNVPVISICTTEIQNYIQ